MHKVGVCALRMLFLPPVEEDWEMAGLFRGSRSGVWDAAAQNARPLSLAIWRISSGESWVESVMIPSGMPRLSSFSVTCFMALYLPSSIATSSARF